MLKPYDSEYNYDKNGCATGIPWWWRSAPYHQWVMNLGEGIPNFFLMGGLLVFAPIATIAAFAESPWWWIGAIIAWLPVLLVLPVQLWACWRTAHSRDTTSSRARYLRVDKYRRLPDKYRRELKPAAKMVDDPSCSSQAEQEWQELVDELFELHGECPADKVASRKVNKQALEAMNKMQDHVKSKKEELKIARDLEEEIRANLKKQNINLEGIDKLYG
jgi:hypothetical protein